MLGFNYCPLSHNLAPSPQVDAPAKYLCWPIRALKSSPQSSHPIKTLQYNLEVTLKSFVAMAAHLLPWQLTGYIFILCLISQIMAQWEKRAQERRGSSKKSADDIRTETLVVPFSTGSRARWSLLTSLLNFFSLCTLCGTNFLIKPKNLCHVQVLTVLLSGGRTWLLLGRSILLLQLIILCDGRS